jgi:hypothetical protein
MRRRDRSSKPFRTRTSGGASSAARGPLKPARASVPPLEEDLREWYTLTPAERFRESQRLWETFLLLGEAVSQSPIPRVLSTFQRHRVKALLMGGQACILYGCAEFTRDVDFAVAVGPGNLDRLRAAPDELEAEVR